MKHLRFGMPTLIECPTLEENAALCKRLGLHFIELNMNLPAFGLDALEDTDTLLRTAGRYGVAFTVHLDERMDVADFNPLVRGAYLETVRRAAAAAARLTELQPPDVPVTLNMHMNHGIWFTLPDRKVLLYGLESERYLGAMRAFRDACTEWIGNSRVRVCVENTDGYLPFEKEAVGLLLESPVFSLTWDIGHSASTGEADEPFLTAHRDRLTHFHIHDGGMNPPRCHLALGDGSIDLDARLALAASVGADCVLETKTAAALERSAAWLAERGLL